MHIQCALSKNIEETNKCIKAFLEDMMKLQAEEIKIELDEPGYNNNFRYASLRSIINGTKPFLKKHNFFFFESTTLSPEKYHVYNFVLMHESGCFIESNYTSAVKLSENDKARYKQSSFATLIVKDTCQPIGMEHTYFNRYARCNILGLTADEADVDKLGTQPVETVVDRTIEDVEKQIDKLISIHASIEKQKAMESIKMLGKNDVAVMYATAERAVQNSAGFLAYYNKKYNPTPQTEKAPVQETAPVDLQELEQKINSAIDVLLGEEALTSKGINKVQVINMLTSLHENKQDQLSCLSNAIMHPEEFVCAMEAYTPI